MDSKDYIIKVRLSGEGNYIQKLKADFKKTIEDKILPDVKNFLNEALLYNHMNSNSSRTLDEFRTQNAGLITRGVLDAITKKNIDLDKSKVRVTKEPTMIDVDIQLILLKEEAFKPDIDPDMIVKKITSLDESKYQRIFNAAAKNLER